MAYTKTTIISSAINLLGKGPITTISEADVFATTAGDTYDILLPAILSTGNWRFATKLAELSQQVTGPIVNEWEYIYTLPADYLAMIRTYPYTTNYAIFEEKTLYSNQDELTIEYRYQAAAPYLPAYFVNYFKAELAKQLSLTGATSESLYPILDKMSSKLYMQAKATDAQSHPSRPYRGSQLTWNR